MGLRVCSTRDHLRACQAAAAAAYSTDVELQQALCPALYRCDPGSFLSCSLVIYT